MFDASGTAGILRIEGISGSMITVEGLAPGSAHLRITDPSDRLLDRTTVRVAAVETIEILPLDVPDRSIDDWALWAGESVRVAIRLLDSAGGRLVDESLRVVPGRPRSSLGPYAWDQEWVGADAPGQHELHIELGNGVSQQVTVRAVELADTITPLDDELESRAHGRASRVCFSLTSDGTRVLGAPWTFEATGMSLQDVEGFTPAGCVWLAEFTAPTGTITTSAGGVSSQFSLRSQ